MGRRPGPDDRPGQGRSRSRPGPRRRPVRARRTARSTTSAWATRWSPRPATSCTSPRGCGCCPTPGSCTRSGSRGAPAPRRLLISVWADDAITQPDSSFDTHLRRPREAMADRVWGGPRRGTVADLFARADAIGIAARRARARAAGHAHRHAVRHQPRVGRLAQHLRQGLRRRPVDVLRLRRDQRRLRRDRSRRRATPRRSRDPVRPAQRAARAHGRRPVRGLHRRTHQRLPDAGHGAGRASARLERAGRRRPGRYRWLRYVGPDGSFCDVAEIEFVAPSREVTVEAPAHLRQLDDNRVVTSYRNTGTRPVYDVRLDLSAYAIDDRAARAVRASGGDAVQCRGAGEDRVDLLAGERPVVGRDWHLRTWSGAQLPARRARANAPAAGGFAARTLDPALEPASIASSSISTRANPRARSCGSPTTPRALSRSAGPTTGLRPPTPASRWRRRRAR